MIRCNAFLRKNQGFPGISAGEEFACNARNPGSIPGWRSIKALQTWPMTSIPTLAPFPSLPSALKS